MRTRASLVCWCIAGTLAALPDVRAASTGGLLLETIGSITSDKGKVVSGARSIKGSYSGTASYTPYLRSDPSRLPLRRNQTYRVTFRYKILSTPDRGFEVLFYSPIAGTQNNFLPSQTVFGAAGTTGSVTLTNTLGSFDDYQVRWNVVGNGAIAIDDIQLTNLTTEAVVVLEDAEPGTVLLSTFFVSASKPDFVWGEPVKVTAAFFDETGKPLTTGPVAWTVVPSTAASVASDGTVTPRALATFTVRGAVTGVTGEVLMQALPKRIVVTPEKSPMLVGSTQKMHADVLDVNDKPIPNAVVGWRVSSEYFDFSNSATIDSAGTGTVARYRNGTWDYLADPSQSLATGAPANNLTVYDANRSCDVVFMDGVGVGAFAGSQYREIQDLQQLTPEGDLLSVSQMLINDDATIYVLGANDRGEEVLYRGTPNAAVY